jgi:sensor domain CHASE-containing protein
MKMRNKVLIIVAALMITIFLTILVTVNIVFLQSFVTLEKQKTAESVTRLTNLLSNEVADISSRVSDWAFWANPVPIHRHDSQNVNEGGVMPRGHS